MGMIQMKDSCLDKHLLLQFFWLFSAFEGALLDEGFFKERGKEVWVDWAEFERQCMPSMAQVSDVEFLLAQKGLVNDPPRKQVIKTSLARRRRDGVIVPEKKLLGWEDQARSRGESEATFAFRMVRSIRNNLFHGGKRSGDVERNSALITRALVFLTHCINAHKGIRSRIPYAA